MIVDSQLQFMPGRWNCAEDRGVNEKNKDESTLTVSLRTLGTVITRPTEVRL